MNNHIKGLLFVTVGAIAIQLHDHPNGWLRLLASLLLGAWIGYLSAKIHN